MQTLHSRTIVSKAAATRHGKTKLKQRNEVSTHERNKVEVWDKYHTEIRNLVDKALGGAGAVSEADFSACLQRGVKGGVHLGENGQISGVVARRTRIRRSLHSYTHHK